MTVHPEIETYLNMRVQTEAPPFSILSAAAARAGQAAARKAANVTPPELHEVRDVAAGPVPLRLYRPKADSKLPGLVFIHGGGWVTGDLDSHDILCRRLALASGCAIIAVDYRLAPEHRCPAAFDDCWAATCWIADNAVALGIDPMRLGVGGDSAGGNLATLVALAARDAQGPELRFQFLLYPCTDLRFGTPAHDETRPGLPIDGPAMDHFRKMYLADPAQADDPAVSPILADLEGLPRTYVQTLEHDPVRDDGRAYVAALKAAGVTVRAEHVADQIHGMLTFGTAMPSVIRHTETLGHRLSEGLGSTR